MGSGGLATRRPGDQMRRLMSIWRKNLSSFARPAAWQPGCLNSTPLSVIDMVFGVNYLAKLSHK
jgi:hypothetical protein